MDSESDSEREVKPFPSKALSSIILILTAFSGLLCLISALWQHLSAAATATMAHAFTYGAAAGNVGAPAMVFGWLGTALILIVFMGTVLLVLTQMVLSKLTEGSELTED